jgi:hypothetical protein
MATADDPPKTFAELSQNVPRSNSPGAFPSQMVVPPETILSETRPSLWGRFWGRLTFFGLLFLLIVVASIGDGGAASEPGAVAFVDFLFALPVIWILAAWWRTAYAITDRRVAAVTGIFGRVSTQANLDDIQDLDFTGGAYGGLKFYVPEKSQRSLLGGEKKPKPRVVWEYVPDPDQVQSFVHDVFRIRASVSQGDRQRASLLAHAEQNMITCEYCGYRVDVRAFASNANPRCPQCGAPLLSSLG